MKLKEVFTQMGICDDEKARRVLNVSNKTAKITAEELENGIALEQLDTIGVPVFRYSTQITIHGKLPDFNPNTRPGGYKCVFQNANKSIGVKYLAIDLVKKQLIQKSSHLVQKSPWAIHLNSTGMEASQWHETKEDCINAYKTFPKDYIIGGICAGAGMLGGYYVLANIGAIPNAHLWELTKFLTGIGSNEEIIAIEETHRQKREEHNTEWAKKMAENAKIILETKIKRKEKLEETHKQMKQLPKGDCEFIRISDTQTRLFIVRKKAFGRLCYIAQQYNGQKPEEPQGKMKVFETTMRDTIEKDIKAGFIFNILNS